MCNAHTLIGEMPITEIIVAIGFDGDEQCLLLKRWKMNNLSGSEARATYH